MNLQSVIAFVGGDYGPSTGAMVNIFFRVLLNLTAATSCWVPLRLFLKNGELAGTSMVVAVALLNFFYAVNALLWPTDDIANWPKGYGWCDVQLILWVPLETLNAAAICAVMQNIANQVSLLRASGLTCEEKKRKRLVQACILFPVPTVQLVLYYFVIAMRYNISGIIGCQAVFDPDWIFMVFFILPCPLFAMTAACFAVLIWIRYHKIDVASRKALQGGVNSANQARAARTRRKLYLMALTIVVPYFPMQAIFLFNNIRLGWPWAKTYNLDQLHSPEWDQLDYSPSTSVSFTSMYINYIAVLEVVVFFLYFGRTKEAHEMYRRYLRALGLGRIFPSLNGEWKPSDRSSTTFKRLWSRAKSASPSLAHSRGSSCKTGDLLTKQSHLDHDEDSQVFNIRLCSLDLEAARTKLAYRPTSNEPRLLSQNSWHSSAIFQLPRIPVLAFFEKKRPFVDDTPSQSSLESMVALLSRRQWAVSCSDDVARPTNISHDNIRVSHQSWEGLSCTRPSLRVSDNAVRCQIASAEKRYLAFPTPAYIPKRATAEGFHSSGWCEEDSLSHADQLYRQQQADFERGLISIRRDFAST